MNLSEEIAKLHSLKESGALSEEEYEKAKESLLAENLPANDEAEKKAGYSATNTNEWAMIIHLSQFCGYIVPLAGLIVPIVLWQIKKDELPATDIHGRIVANWVITEIILWIICVLLLVILIGIPLMIALAVVGIVFPIVGAVKASNGEAWPYPCSIRFFSLD